MVCIIRPALIMKFQMTRLRNQILTSSTLSTGVCQLEQVIYLRRLWHLYYTRNSATIILEVKETNNVEFGPVCRCVLLILEVVCLTMFRDKTFRIVIEHYNNYVGHYLLCRFYAMPLQFNVLNMIISF
jgi:hypothetical protein